MMALRPLSVALVAICLTCSAPPPELDAPMQSKRQQDELPRAHPRRLLISGHSLTDRPFPDFLEALAGHAGRPLAWNLQHLAGSSIMDRLPHAKASIARGVQPDQLRISPADAASPHGEPFDSLILTERHTLLDSLVRDDTIGQAATLAARFRAASADGRIYFFSSWLNLDRRDDPTRWIDYEAAAGRAWRCTARQIEHILAAQGEVTDIRLIPAAEALAGLVAASADQWRKSGAPDARRTVDLLFVDDVHLTRAGTYFIALITHGVLHGELPSELWVPAHIEPGLAAELQRFARQFLAAQMRHAPAEDPASCRSWFARHYVPHYLSYVRDVRWRREGTARAYLKWVRHRLAWPALLGKEGPANPFS